MVLTVNAVAGARAILLAIDEPDGASTLAHCMGFAIQRQDEDDDHMIWLRPTSTQQSPAPNTVDEVADSLAKVSLDASFDPCANPIRSFRWLDFTVVPGKSYKYRLHKVVKGSSGSRQLEHPSVCVAVAAEPEAGHPDAIEAYFNRGSTASQAYARQFGSLKPRDKRGKEDRSPWEWLSRGLEEGILEFIHRASGAGWGLRCAFYELSYYPVLRALQQCREAGADVSFVYDGKLPSWHAEKREWTEHGPAQLNDLAITTSGLRDVAIRRAAAPSAIQHNKFIILLKDNEPVCECSHPTRPWLACLACVRRACAIRCPLTSCARDQYRLAFISHLHTQVSVWTGSTNITTSGLFGHFNVGHVTTDASTVRSFHRYWVELSKDPSIKKLAAFNAIDSPVPSLDARGCFVIFSPRDSDEALRYYSDLIRAARDSVFLTAAFGLSATIAEGLLHAPPGSLAPLPRGKAAASKSSPQASTPPPSTPPSTPPPSTPPPSTTPPPPSTPHDISTYVLLDNVGRGSSPRFVEAVRRLPHAHVACGSHFEEAGMANEGQLAEQLTELNQHVQCAPLPHTQCCSAALIGVAFSTL